MDFRITVHTITAGFTDSQLDKILRIITGLSERSLRNHINELCVENTKQGALHKLIKRIAKNKYIPEFLRQAATEQLAYNADYTTGQNCNIQTHIGIQVTVTAKLLDDLVKPFTANNSPAPLDIKTACFDDLKYHTPYSFLLNNINTLCINPNTDKKAYLHFQPRIAGIAALYCDSKEFLHDLQHYFSGKYFDELTSMETSSEATQYKIQGMWISDIKQLLEEKYQISHNEFIELIPCKSDDFESKLKNYQRWKNGNGIKDKDFEPLFHNIANKINIDENQFVQLASSYWFHGALGFLIYSIRSEGFKKNIPLLHSSALKFIVREPVMNGLAPDCQTWVNFLQATYGNKQPAERAA